MDEDPKDDAAGSESMPADRRHGKTWSVADPFHVHAPYPTASSGRGFSAGFSNGFS
jgi:hypothetical protein